MKKVHIAIIVCICAVLIFGIVLGIIIFTSPQDKILGTWEMTIEDSEILLPEFTNSEETENKIHSSVKNTMKFYSDNTGYIETHAVTTLDFYFIHLTLIDFKANGYSEWIKTGENSYRVWLKDDVSFDASIADGAVLGFIKYLIPLFDIIPAEYTAGITDFLKTLILPYENENGVELRFSPDKLGKDILISQSGLVYGKIDDGDFVEKLWGKNSQKVNKYFNYKTYLEYI